VKFGLFNSVEGRLKFIEFRKCDVLKSMNGLTSMTKTVSERSIICDISTFDISVTASGREYFTAFLKELNGGKLELEGIVKSAIDGMDEVELNLFILKLDNVSTELTET
jgi:hypothetical protein